LTLNHINTSRY